MSDQSNRLVVGYVRVSTAKQASEGQSIEAQEDRIKIYAKANGLHIDKIYRENGVSGKDTNRPALGRLLTDLDTIAAVIVYKLDRISRSVVDLYRLIDDFERRGVAFKSVCEGVDTQSAVGRFMMAVLASLAQMERELIGERTKDTLAHKKEKGEHCGRVPYGYRAIEAGSLVRDPEQQRVIARIKRLRRCGKSIRDISRRLSVPKSTVHTIINTHQRSRNSRYG